MPLMLMDHAKDPAQEVRDRIGDLADVEVFGNAVLVGIYMRPTVTKSGIVLPDQVRKEDEFQGKAGLVLKLGPDAFMSDKSRDFGSLRVSEGDWVFFRPSDGLPIAINDKDGLCRLLDDVDIRGRIAAPDKVW